MDKDKREMITPEFQTKGHKAENKSATRKKNKAKLDKKPCRVLLVEDDADDMYLEKKRLEASGKVSEVLCFSDGQELIDYMKQQGFQDRSVMCLKPTVIVLDLNMPKVSGFEVLKQLKSDPFLQEIPVIVVSEHTSYENVQRAHRLKADAFFSKPMNVYKLQTFLSRGWQWPKAEMWMR